MADLQSTIASGLTARYKKLAGTVRELAEPLSDDQFWAKPFDFGNSFGHLVLHLTGNLNYYIGAQIAETGYVRDRPLEFSDATRPSKEDVLKKFDQAIGVVLAAINDQTAEDWSKDCTAIRADARNRLEMVLICATHLDHHVGQMMYLGFELKRKGK
ncbi:MAG: DinB family protein [Terriglobales bacterium]